jgi:hypothetical protein
MFSLNWPSSGVLNVKKIAVPSVMMVAVFKIDSHPFHPFL